MSGTPFSIVNNIHVHTMIPEDQFNRINVFTYVTDPEYEIRPTTRPTVQSGPY